MRSANRVCSPPGGRTAIFTRPSCLSSRLRLQLQRRRSWCIASVDGPGARVVLVEDLLAEHCLLPSADDTQTRATVATGSTSAAAFKSGNRPRIRAEPGRSLHGQWDTTCGAIPMRTVGSVRNISLVTDHDRAKPIDNELPRLDLGALDVTK